MKNLWIGERATDSTMKSMVELFSLQLEVLKRCEMRQCLWLHYYYYYSKYHTDKEAQDCLGIVNYD